MGNNARYNLVTAHRLITVDELKPYSTAFLLMLKIDYYRLHYLYRYRYEDNPEDIAIQNVQTLKSVLDTRPHVPNKLESKAARILRKKQGKGR